MPNIGDKVKYVPDLGHAYDENPQGQFAYIFVGGSEKKELTDEKVRFLIRHIQLAPHDRALLAPLRPRFFWDATVKEVHPNGELDLDVTNGCLPFITLHYFRIKHDPTKQVPHTWHDE